jgi:ATP-dependent protease ClpP protease subunit
MRAEKVRGAELLGIQEQALDQILGSGVDFPKRTIYLVDEVSFEMASRLLIAVTKLDETPGPIRVVLISTGGHEPAGWVIYDAIRAASNYVTVDAYGAVFSMAVAILQAGDWRRMSRECRLMVHPGQIEMGDSVDQRALISVGKEMESTNLRYQRVLAERTSMNPQRMADFCDKESFFSAEEALNEGFIDEIIPYVVPDTSKSRKESRR